MSLQPQQNSINNAAASLKSPSFDDISNHFCLPFSDAASVLGICGNVLKKICHENGLDRWPYRRFLAGKTIEEIKRDAAQQKAALSKIGQSRANKPAHTTQQQGTKSYTVGSSNILHSTSLTKAMTSLDEFKYGFPSDGLSTVANKWWVGNNSDKDVHEDGNESSEEDKHLSEGKTKEGANSVEMNRENRETGNGVASNGSRSLMAIRKRVVEEGREALKLGVHRGYGSNKLSRRDKALLVRIFQSSLPKEWISDSS